MEDKDNVSVLEIIRRKRDNRELSDRDIRTFVSRLVTKVGDGRIHDAQIGAFLMAVFLNGLSPTETIHLTKAMTYSGFTFRWPDGWKGKVVDKHSTGGVGDKVSLILAPALAACGLKVPMVSGRGLDFTGGTLDKLEAIPGFTVSISPDQMRTILMATGCVIVGQTEDLVPADRLLYRIRDTTATVDNQELIVASIISKKAAEGLDALVLDIKTGSGAFMADYMAASSLASKMVKAGRGFGMKVTGVITRMDSPLGNAVGNALEVAEAIDALQNKGPSDVQEIVFTLGAELLESTGHAIDLDDGKRLIALSIENGSALAAFYQMIMAQGTNPTTAQELCYGDKWKCLPKADFVREVKVPSSGYIENIDAMTVAKACHALGCGRTKPGEPVKLEPGIVLSRKPGDRVEEGDVLLQVHHNDGIPQERLDWVLSTLLKGVVLTDQPPCHKPLVMGKVV